MAKGASSKQPSKKRGGAVLSSRRGRGGKRGAPRGEMYSEGRPDSAVDDLKDPGISDDEDDGEEKATIDVPVAMISIIAIHGAAQESVWHVWD